MRLPRAAGGGAAAFRRRALGAALRRFGVRGAEIFRLRRRWGMAVRAAALPAALLAASGAVAQEAGAPLPQGPIAGGLTEFTVPSPVLVLDQEALFAGSAFGRRVQGELEAESAALTAENRQIEADLMKEEQALTVQRGSLPPEDFVALARSFDGKVQRIRAEQDGKARELQARVDAERQRFLSQVAPLLAELVRARGAVAIIDRKAILLAFDGIDITEAAIEAVDTRLGSGAGQAPPGLPAATGTDPAAEDAPRNVPAAPGDAGSTPAAGAAASPGDDAPPEGASASGDDALSEGDPASEAAAPPEAAAPAGEGADPGVRRTGPSAPGATGGVASPAPSTR